MPTDTTNPLAAAERATEQVREFGERAAGAGRALGQLALDTYEQAVRSLVEFEQQAADAAPVEWMKAAIGAHASLVGDLNAAYLRAARSALD
jgi:hypothetical protein